MQPNRVLRDSCKENAKAVCKFPSGNPLKWKELEVIWPEGRAFGLWFSAYEYTEIQKTGASSERSIPFVVLVSLGDQGFQFTAASCLLFWIAAIAFSAFPIWL